jgi:protoheme IX farnesyltransferase
VKVTSEPFIVTAPIAKVGWVSIISDLVKARLTFLVLLTTLVGFYLGSVGPFDPVLMIATLLGTGLMACGAAALNQLSEREFDAKMRRTRTRPLPSGQLQPDTVLIFGAVCAMAGLICLAFAVNLLTSFLGALTLITYLFVYTPLKRKTWLNTAVGAIPGALPPLMGWTAARNDLDPSGWSLFAVLFFWQIPHFLAIAWMYREDYANAGFVMLPSVDTDGFRTGRQAVSHTFGLLFMSLLPVALGLTGVIYFGGAVLLGGVFLICAFQFSRSLSLLWARRLFFASIVYLPLLLILMVADKIKH